jgi:hypothetical protein
MSATIENLDTVITDAPVELADISFGKEIAKTLIISAAATAGMMGGALAVGLVMNKTSEFKQKRAAKKAAVKATLVDVTDKTPANENN